MKQKKTTKPQKKTPVQSGQHDSAESKLPEASEGIGLKSLPLSKQLKAQAVRALKMWQESKVDEAGRAAALDVAELALELARLRGQIEPLKFLDEAARLMTEARFALGREQARPAREQREQMEQFERIAADAVRPSVTWTWGKEGKTEVPFAMLYKPGKSDSKDGGDSKHPPVRFEMQNGMTPPQLIEFTWEVFASQRGFRSCIERYVRAEKPEWDETVVSQAVDQRWQSCQAGRWPVDQVYDLHQFRKHRDSDRSRKAMETRLAKSRPKKMKQPKGAGTDGKNASA